MKRYSLRTTTRKRLFPVDLARIAVMTALIAVLGLPGAFPIFGLVPITAQTLGVMLAGAILGPLRGALSVVVLLTLTAVGAPLLAGGRGGLGVFLTPSAGYLLGWIPAAVVIGMLVHWRGLKPTMVRTLAANVVGGILVVYAVGIPIQSALTGLTVGETALTSVVFLPGDVLKVVVGALIVKALVEGYPRAYQRDWPGREITVEVNERARSAAS